MPVPFKKALFWKKSIFKTVQCQLCPRNCKIAENQKGFCRVKENIQGNLYSLVYGKPCSVNVDPIEKKPLFHFAPGTQCLSIATVGCNLNCKFCQNWEISIAEEITENEVGGFLAPQTFVGSPQAPKGCDEMNPEAVVEFAKKYNVPGIAYTYTEPTIALEYYLDIMKLARKEGLYNIWVSNGYINPLPAKKAARFLDAINMDLKGDSFFYQSLCGVPNENPMKNALKIYKENGVWIEITNLLIPGFNDKKNHIEKLVKWVKSNLGIETPIHFSRFYPQYKMVNKEKTPLETLKMAANVADDLSMWHVYLGNIQKNARESTYCPHCGKLVIERFGYKIMKMNLKSLNKKNWKKPNYMCNFCGKKLLIFG